MAPTAIPTEGAVVMSKLPSSGVSASAMLHRNLREEPRKVVAAEGNYLTFSDGTQIFDATGGAAVSCLGHGNERVKQAVLDQMNIVSYCTTLTFTTQAGEDLASELIASTNGKMARAYIVNSGSEAMEAAMKMARQYFVEIGQPNRTRFIARKESYHGTTLGGLSLGGHVARRAVYEPILLDNTSHVSPCNTYRGMRKNESLDDFVQRLAEELDAEFRKFAPETVCAFVAEPVVGAALGCVPSVPGYFKAMKEVCDRHGTLLIMDEIMCGMGRTGTLHAWEHEGVLPDIQSIGKGLGGGYAPVAGLLIGHRVINALQKGTAAFVHGHTYQGHPMACAAALEVQRIVREQNLMANVRKMGALMESLLRERLGDHPNVGNIRGRGLFWGMELVKDKATKKAFPPKEGIAMAVHELGLKPEFGIFLYPGSGTVDGIEGDHVMLSPAYNITKSDVETIVDLTAKVIESFFKNRA